MIRGEFAVDEGIDDSLGERLYFFIDETIIYMLVAADAKVVSVVRTSHITRGESVHVGKILGDRGISLRRGSHIEVARDKGGKIRELLCVLTDKSCALYLALVAKAKVCVHKEELFPALFLRENHVLTHTVMRQAIPASRLDLRGIREPEISALYKLEFILSPEYRRGLYPSRRRTVLIEHSVFFSELLLYMRLPKRRIFLKSHNVGRVGLDDLSESGRALLDRMSVLVVQTSYVKAYNL